MPLFSKKDLKDLATPSSYERGQEYYNEGLVRKITRTGNLFEGSVAGSYRYRVRLEIQNGNLLFNCSCPYDYSGICKHCVAFGLAVLDEDFTDAAGYAVLAEDAQIVEDTDDKTFEENFNKATFAQKEAFLRQLFTKDHQLRSQFLNFIGSTEKSTPAKKPVSQMDAIRENVYEALSSLAFDEDMFEEYGDSYGYESEGDELVDIAKEMIGEILEPHINPAIRSLVKGKLPETLAIILAVYEGIRLVEDPDADEFSLFEGDGYQESILNVFNNLLKECISEINRAIFPEEDINRALDFLVERYVYHESKFNRDTDDLQVIYQLKHFEALLIALLTSPKTALHLQDLLEKHHLVDNDTAYVMLHIAQLTNNEALWLQTAEDFARYEPEIALQLLDKYRLTGKKTHFARIARQALEMNAVLFDEYIITHLKPEEDLELYVNALSRYTRRKKSIEHYRILREYYTPDERAAFIKAYANGYDHLFYMLLLEVEGRYQEILTYIRQFKNQEIYNFDKMLATVAHLFPNECMDLAMDKIEHALQSDRRDRRTYQEITSWLKVLKAIPALEEQLRVFSNYLYDHHTRLRALREELQYAGLVRKR